MSTLCSVKCACYGNVMYHIVTNNELFQLPTRSNRLAWVNHFASVFPNPPKDIFSRSWKEKTLRKQEGCITILYHCHYANLKILIKKSYRTASPTSSKWFYTLQRLTISHYEHWEGKSNIQTVLQHVCGTSPGNSQAAWFRSTCAHLVPTIPMRPSWWEREHWTIGSRLMKVCEFVPEVIFGEVFQFWIISVDSCWWQFKF